MLTHLFSTNILPRGLLFRHNPVHNFQLCYRSPPSCLLQGLLDGVSSTPVDYKPSEEGTGAPPSSPSHSSTQQNGPLLPTVCFKRYKRYKYPQLLLISRFFSHPRP